MGNGALDPCGQVHVYLLTANPSWNKHSPGDAGAGLTWAHSTRVQRQGQAPARAQVWLSPSLTPRVFGLSLCHNTPFLVQHRREGGRGQDRALQTAMASLQPKPQVPCVLTHCGGPRAKSGCLSPQKYLSPSTTLTLNPTQPQPLHVHWHFTVKVHHSLPIDRALLQRQNHTVPPKPHQTWIRTGTRNAKNFPNGNQIHPHILLCCSPTAHTNPSLSLFLPEAYDEIPVSQLCAPPEAEMRAQRPSGCSPGRAHGVSTCCAHQPGAVPGAGLETGAETAVLPLPGLSRELRALLLQPCPSPAPGEHCCARSSPGAHSWPPDCSVHRHWCQGFPGWSLLRNSCKPHCRISYSGPNHHSWHDQSLPTEGQSRVITHAVPTAWQASQLSTRQMAAASDRRQQESYFTQGKSIHSSQTPKHPSLEAPSSYWQQQKKTAQISITQVSFCCWQVKKVHSKNSEYSAKQFRNICIVLFLCHSINLPGDLSVAWTHSKSSSAKPHRAHSQLVCHTGCSLELKVWNASG